MLPTLDELIAHGNSALPRAEPLGHSRDGRPVKGYRFPGGARRISLIAGCHADEPVGPRLLDCLARYLGVQPDDAPARTHNDWWIVPHINPDGAERNRAWSEDAPGALDAFDFATYLRAAVREPPGDDIEFGFPRDDGDTGARPEPAAVVRWWKSEPAPFAMHASLHGMAVAAGPWFLIDPDWVDRCELIKDRCRAATARLGYTLHDVERNGEKGFHRIERGFCTRPNSEAMAAFFLERNDAATAALFRPSSMETVRALGGDPLTLVSEIPLFTLPGVGETIAPVDPVADEWRDRITRWRSELRDEAAIDRVRRAAAEAGVRAVPVRDQMELQWQMIRAGTMQLERAT